MVSGRVISGGCESGAGRGGGSIRRGYAAVVWKQRVVDVGTGGGCEYRAETISGGSNAGGVGRLALDEEVIIGRRQRR